MDLKGLPLFVMVTPAGMHNSVAAREALFRLRPMHREITIVWADLAYAGTSRPGPSPSSTSQSRP